MKKKSFCAIALWALSVAVLPLSAQDDWPEGCQLPDLEAALSAANAAQVNGDVTDYLDALGDMVNITSLARKSCLEALVADGVDLAEADLYSANLEGARLNEINLEGAYLEYANLQGADLYGANLQWADMEYVSLPWAHLVEANLSRADLDGANLQWADLSRANLAESDVRSAIFAETTFLPDEARWTPDTDLARFTDPEHPDFWNPCVELERPPWYCEDSDD